MSLMFPNTARSYDDAKRRIRFLGHDGMFEVKFFVDADVVIRELPHQGASERELLVAFDRMLDKIHVVAARLYKKNARTSITIGRSDF